MSVAAKEVAWTAVCEAVSAADEYTGDVAASESSELVASTVLV